MKYYTHYDSPIGQLLLLSDGTSIIQVAMPMQMSRVHFSVDWQKQDNLAPLQSAMQQLDEYFAGQRKKFDLPLQFAGTQFQNRVWHELQRIHYGEVISYGELARRVGNPNASRAVGLANGKNPLSIFVPCHRVVGANGSLTGYAGGLEAKKLLLELERVA